jgi:hypothetical protein
MTYLSADFEEMTKGIHRVEFVHVTVNHRWRALQLGREAGHGRLTDLVEALSQRPIRGVAIPDSLLQIPRLGTTDATKQVPNAPLELLLVPFHEDAVVVARIVIDAALGQEIKPHRVDSPAVDGVQRMDHVAEGL